MTYIYSHYLSAHARKDEVSILKLNTDYWMRKAKMSHIVDIVFCIDCTGSMSPVLEHSKGLALGFHDELQAGLEERQKSVDELRVKVIAFRDFFVDGKHSLLESDFFQLPDETSAYSNFLNDLTATGGGDEPESALEAFAIAMRSEWNKSEGRKRQIIIIMTDASAHPLEKAASSPPAGYPPDMPINFDEIAKMWEVDMDNNARRLVMFAPIAYPWTDIFPDDSSEQSGFSATIHFPSRGGEGLKEVDADDIINMIVNSI